MHDNQYRDGSTSQKLNMFQALKRFLRYRLQGPPGPMGAMGMQGEPGLPGPPTQHLLSYNLSYNNASITSEENISPEEHESLARLHLTNAVIEEIHVTGRDERTGKLQVEIKAANCSPSLSLDVNLVLTPSDLEVER